MIKTFNMAVNITSLKECRTDKPLYIRKPELHQTETNNEADEDVPALLESMGPGWGSSGPWVGNSWIFILPNFSQNIS